MTNDVSSNKKCENCSSLISEIYGSGRFCGVRCARSYATKANRKVINMKVSSKMKGKRVWGEEHLAVKKAWAQEWANKQKEAKLIRLVKVRGDVLDITYGQLEQYRKVHRQCEMCNALPNSSKNAYNKNLVIDHCHKTGHFRGLLCISCNRFLGYYENSKDLAEKYLNRTALVQK